MQNILEVKNLSKQYGQQYALRDVSLSIKKGEIYGLIGKNGAGKSTLIKIVTRIIHASSGRVSLFGSSNSQEWTEALSRVGAVIETPVAHAHLTAFDNLLYYCIERKIDNPSKVIQECLTYVGLTKTGKKKFSEFSLGMKQRLGIAITLLAKPDLLILDEPINGLDPVGIKEFRGMIRRLNQELGITIIISSHILSELYLVANKFGIINQGRLVTEFTKEEFDRESEDYVVLKTDRIQQAGQLVQDKLHYQLKPSGKDDELHILAQPHEIRDITRELVLSDIAIDEIYAPHRDLEKYFTNLVE
ncbi:ATP-binding cassette domain-containing protein [Streptococcus panodentis]|uniref:ABC transporter n=1 Tax=Streptococcus panodentis TaxID=1581472 RepID=A0ABS5AWP4_9STRE|nr:ATP-binding cassette domain-containing protein [Streptococcus panodentis]MBP2620149.1 ABC transporter [Streptococcus panodentis]